jgi:hypothetical protein
VQYVNEYDSYGYTPPAAALNYHLQQSTAVREGYHLSPTAMGNYYVSNGTPTNIGVSRVRSEASRLVSSQVKNEDVVKGTYFGRQVRVG